MFHVYRSTVVFTAIGYFGWLVCSQVVIAGQPTKHRTDWFCQAKYGLMVHYLNGVQNNPEHVASLGRQTSWDECVREFDVERFAQQAHQAGAGYVIFSALQLERFLIAPNATYDRLTGYQPGQACSQRDLIEDLYQALHKRGIPLMLYWTGDGPAADPQAAQRLGWPIKGPDDFEFVKKWAQVIQEYGLRYKEKIRGFWVDGCYRWTGYDDQKLAVLAEAMRTGYPDRILAFNPGVESRVQAYSRHEDFTCGEQNAFFDFPLQRFIDGKQWHILSFLGMDWAEPGTVKGKRELADYVLMVTSAGGVVSIDVLVYRDGQMDRSQLEVLKELRPRLAARQQEVHAWRQGKAVPAHNKAWKKPARLLNVDGHYELRPSGGVHAAHYGVDGDPNTIAQAGGEWPWTYEVHLLGLETIRRIVIHFGTDYATELEVLASADKENWQLLGRFQDQKGQPVEIRLTEPVQARLVRIRGLKPDGPNQPGSQMSIAELEIYE
ncbi:MAG: alpha-L-fucosidase [Thermoguttaceae bacterium]|nr:alpha-L-fucosidase [Thermoguttaceae bacterium]MDW8036921.1 alpha-L-fucosidase [Thermoguttaceae bacterium]